MYGSGSNLKNYANRKPKATELENENGWTLESKNYTPSLDQDQLLSILNGVLLALSALILVSLALLVFFFPQPYVALLGLPLCFGLIISYLFINTLTGIHREAILREDGLSFNNETRINWNQVQSIDFKFLTNSITFKTSSGEKYDLSTKINGLGTLRRILDQNLSEKFKSIKNKKIKGIPIFPKPSPESAELKKSSENCWEIVHPQIRDQKLEVKESFWLGNPVFLLNDQKYGEKENVLTNEEGETVDLDAHLSSDQPVVFLDEEQIKPKEKHSEHLSSEANFIFLNFLIVSTVILTTLIMIYILYW